MSHDSRHRVAHHSSMRVDRGYLFWGVFFVLLGAIPLAERQGWIDVGGLGDVGRLWPLIIIGIGIAILASRTRLALVATVVGALVLGTLAGTALASFGGGVFECVRTGEPQLQRTTQDGTLGPESAVRLDIDCGDLDVRTAPGTVWTLDAGHAGDPPRVEASATQLRIRPADGVARRQDWALVVPGALDTLDLDANASSATLQLEGATLGRLRTSINAGDLRVVAPTGRMESLVIDVNAGDVDLLAPSTDITNLEVQANAASLELGLGGTVSGSIDGAAMSVRVCVPPAASLHIEAGDDFAFSHNLDSSGLSRSGDVWERAGTGPRISLQVGGTASSFTLDQTGACT